MKNYVKEYSTTKGRKVNRPRKRMLGQMSDELKRELESLTLFDRKKLEIASSFALIAMGVNLMGV